MNSKPIFLPSRTDGGRPLNRIEIPPRDDRDEAWLQALIYTHPEILPVADFDEAFSPAISVGREITTAAGSIDNLYVSPAGSITVVETKLWRNPEKHRTVVAQVIDYAKELSQWDYDQLNASILKAARNTEDSEKRSLEQIVNPYLQSHGLTITDFQERVISSLENGEFLLLIIGDRISPNLAMLSESISGAPGLDFRLGLIEMQLYPLNENQEWPLLIIPDIVGRTVERTRGVIKVQYVHERPKLDIEVEESEKPGQTKGKTTQDVFLKKAPDDLATCYEQWLSNWQEMGLVIYWGVTGFSLRVSVSGKLQTVLDAYPEWAVSLVREGDADRFGVSKEIYREYLDKIGSVPSAVGLLSAGKKYIKHKDLTSENLMTILQATTEFINSILEKTREL
jgi:uncharacterized protein YlzI (FlbEa/FlbD family)